MAHFISLTHAATAQRVLVNMDLVRHVVSMANGSRLTFADDSDALHVTENQAEIALQLASR